jgi:hypothetical protein
MPLSRHKAASRAEIGEICELLCESLVVLGIPANARWLRNALSREAALQGAERCRLWRQTGSSTSARAG